MKVRTSAVFLFMGAFAVAGDTTLRAAGQTTGANPVASIILEGTVSDAKCGAKHMMKDAVACTKACVDKGSGYQLVVGDKVWALKTSAQQKTELGKLAGKMAKITGDINVNGLAVIVKTVEMAQKN